jgi:hypothetical protein
MQVDKISDEIMQEIFEVAFENKIGAYNNLSEFEPIIKRSAREEDILMEVTVTGMAGSPTMEDFKSGRVENAERLKIEDVRGELTYVLQADETVPLNSTDYVITYKLELE